MQYYIFLLLHNRRSDQEWGTTAFWHMAQNFRFESNSSLISQQPLRIGAIISPIYRCENGGSALPKQTVLASERTETWMKAYVNEPQTELGSAGPLLTLQPLARVLAAVFIVTISLHLSPSPSIKCSFLYPIIIFPLDLNLGLLGFLRFETNSWLAKRHLIFLQQPCGGGILLFF